MQESTTVLSIIRERGKQGLPLERLYRQLYNPALYLKAYGKLAAHRDFLRYLFIVSEVELAEPNAELAADTITVTISRARGEKCERCWNYSTRVGEASKFPTVCERCVAALEEMQL